MQYIYLFNYHQSGITASDFRHNYCYSMFQGADSKREEFRKYLEKAGVLDALTKGKNKYFIYPLHHFQTCLRNESTICAKCKAKCKIKVCQYNIHFFKIKIMSAKEVKTCIVLPNRLTIINL